MKQIIVPLSAEAMKKLDYDQADDDELYIVKLSEQEVDLLFEKNFFKEWADIPPKIYQNILFLTKLAIAKQTGLFFFF